MLINKKEDIALLEGCLITGVAVSGESFVLEVEDSSESRTQLTFSASPVPKMQGNILTIGAQIMVQSKEI